MKLFGVKATSSHTKSCKKHLVVADRGVAKIFYFRLYPDKEGDELYTAVYADDQLIEAINKYFSSTKVAELDLKDIILTLKDTYNALKKDNNEDSTIATLEEYFLHNNNAVYSYFRGILMDDGSYVFFYDFSDRITASVNTIFPKGGLF